MYYIGLDVHKKTISYCVKDAAGHVHSEGKIGSTRRELDAWVRTLPQPRMIALEATIFTGWIYDHLLPHAEKVKVAHPLMVRAIAAAKRKNDRLDHDLKNLFKGAAATASTKPGPFQEFYAALVAKGMRPEMARLTLARKIATIVLIVWKKGVCFDANHLKPQTA